MAMSIAPSCSSARFSFALPSASLKNSLISTSPLVRLLISSAHHLSTSEPAETAAYWLLARSTTLARLACAVTTVISSAADAVIKHFDSVFIVVPCPWFDGIGWKMQ